MKSQKFREVVKKIKTVILGLVIGLVLAEVVTRVYVFGWKGLNPSEMKSYVGLKDSGIIQPSSNSKLSYELKPSLNTIFRFNSLKTNDQGFRDDKYSLPKSKNLLRIAVIGDSYTMGWGVESDKNYTELLEQNLNTIDSTHFEILNFGTPGYGLSDYIEILKTKVLDHKPDLVLLGFCEKNDFQKSNKKDSEIKFIEGGKKNGFFRSYFLALIRKTIRVYKSKGSNMKKTSPDYLRESFTEIDSIVKGQDIPIGLIYLSIAPQEANKQVARHTAHENNIFFIDASARFTDLSAKDFVVDVLDSHPNEKAHRIFSEAIMNSSELKSFLSSKDIEN